MPISPTTLNQPVNHDQAGPPSLCAHQYGPPAVGKAEVSSDMLTATAMMMSAMTGQPIEIAIGPPNCHAWPYSVKQPASTEMIENEIAKFANLDHPRSSSCL